MHWIRYSLVEALQSAWRQRGSVLQSVLTIGAAMFVLGAFLLAGANLDRALARWSAAAEFSVYLRDDITPASRGAINGVLDRSPLVAARDYVSREDALRRFTQDFPDLSAGVKSLPQNPLPASIELRLNPQHGDAAAVDALAAQMRALPGVADVRFDRGWLERLGRVASAIRWAGWILGAVLLAAAVLTVATVVRLALHARRDEVEIMQLMGTPLGLLRGPFVVEGILQGGVGAALALAALAAVYAGVQYRFGPDLGGLVDPSLLGFLPPSWSLLFLCGGMAVGGLGGMVASRRVR
jgi:cell division transport system permease protein